ncbi:MAG: RND family efflux transporter, MFP subunit, partial [Halomonas sp. HL-93]
MSPPTRKMYLGIMLVVTASVAALACIQAVSSESDTTDEPTAQPSLSVNVTTLKSQTLPTTIEANGDIAAWQEISVGSEISGLRLVDVKVDVGDEVTEGQVLAVYNDRTVRAELARSRAAVAEAEATLAEATANAQRGRGLKTTGSLSEQQIQQYETAELTARARLEVAQAENEAQAIRLAQTEVVVPDDGLITSRTATVGAVTGADQELFRLTRNGRLEWRAEVAASDLNKLR